MIYESTNRLKIRIFAWQAGFIGHLFLISSQFPQPSAASSPNITTRSSYFVVWVKLMIGMRAKSGSPIVPYQNLAAMGLPLCYSQPPILHHDFRETVAATHRHLSYSSFDLDLFPWRRLLITGNGIQNFPLKEGSGGQSW